jgi:Fe-Mn family superoxide dismutase
MLPYVKKDFSHLLGLTGLSDQLLQNHFTLYEGYVTNTNKIIEFLDTQEIGSPEYSELQRRLGWEWNGMRLHELYFANMTKEAAPLVDGPLKEKIVSTYGSFEAFEKGFLGTGAMRGIGWVLLVHDTEADELYNIWVNEHDMGLLASCKILLVMDVFEHAFMLDYGIKRADYLTTFMNALDWDVVNKRFA